MGAKDGVHGRATDAALPCVCSKPGVQAECPNTYLSLQMRWEED